MGAITKLLMLVLPFFYRFVRGLLVVRKGISVIPFLIGVITSFSLMYSQWHLINEGVKASLQAVTSALSSIDVGGNTALCWVTAFGVYTALRLVATALAIGITMLITQWIALQTFIITQYLLGVAIQAVGR